MGVTQSSLTFDQGTNYVPDKFPPGTLQQVRHPECTLGGHSPADWHLADASQSPDARAMHERNTIVHQKRVFVETHVFGQASVRANHRR